MVKYENSKIYRIIDNTNGNIYIGSTVKTLAQRLAQHRASYKQYLEGKSGNCKSYDILANGDFDIILLEKCENITSKEQLHARERHYIDSLECVNKYKPGKLKELGKEEYHKEYYEDNKDKIKQWREENKDKIKQYQKEYQKEYYEDNKEHHKEQMREKMSQKITCPYCNCEFMRGNKFNHERTAKHRKAHIDALN